MSDFNCPYSCLHARFPLSLSSFHDACMIVEIGCVHPAVCPQGAEIYTYTRDIPGADLDPALKPIIFPYIDLNLQVGIKGTHGAQGLVLPGSACISPCPEAGN